MKLTESFITKQNVQKDVVLLEMTRNILEHLYSNFNEIMSPIMQNPAN